MDLISIVTPCYNEEENVEALYERVKALFPVGGKYRYEHLFIDNCSTDNTATILRSLAGRDRNVKVILNTRNFGHIRSPYYGLLQVNGAAAILMVADFQDPPELVPEFLKKWEAGYKLVFAVKTSSGENPLLFRIRRTYYAFLSRISAIRLTQNFTGYGLYDNRVLQVLRKIDDPYPYFRGLLSDLGFEPATIEFRQPRRERGITKNNFYTLYDMAMLGIVNHSKAPLRLAAFLGFIMSIFSLFMAGLVFIAKICFWNHFTVGIAPLLISLFFFSSVLLFFIGILGEYVAAIHTQVQKRPLVIERERINFENGSGSVVSPLLTFTANL